VSDFQLSDFQIARELQSSEERLVYSAKCRGEENVRLTVFSAEMSQRAEFRRALKTDRAMLSMLQHQSILRFLGSGESDGALFFWTESCDYPRLTEHLEQGRAFSAEDVIEIGWQTCSALQLAHNRGLAHGGLSLDTILLSEYLQVTLTDFCVARWMKAGQKEGGSPDVGPALITMSALASQQEVEKDLSDLGSILIRLLQTSQAPSEPSEEGRASPENLLERLLTRVTSQNPSQRPVSAREFQGRLGEILIGNDDDAMPLVDRRKSSGTSKRSIVVELFEPQESSGPVHKQLKQSAGFAWRGQILPILTGLAIIVILILLAGLLF
jgi:hypothetical protein